MHYYTKLFALLALITIAISCSKKGGAAPAPPPPNTLGGSPGLCTPATIAGTFTKGVALSALNTVTVQMNVGYLGYGGLYSVNTDTVNGVSFRKSGTFAGTGVNDVVLTGTGTPTNSGAYAFTVKAVSSTCTFSLNFN